MEQNESHVVENPVNMPHNYDEEVPGGKTTLSTRPWSTGSWSHAGYLRMSRVAAFLSRGVDGAKGELSCLKMP